MTTLCRHLLIGAAIAFLGGCATTDVKDVSPNAEYYSLIFLHKPKPTAQQIFAEGLIQQSDKTVAETWTNCLRVGAQTSGILMIDESVPENPTMVMISGLATPVTLSLLTTTLDNLSGNHDITKPLDVRTLFNAEEKKSFAWYIRNMEAWLAVSVKPGLLPGTAQIAVAFYDPSRNGVKPFPPVAEPSPGSDGIAGPQSAAQAWARNASQHSAAVSNWADPKKAPDRRWKSVPLLAADEFLSDLETQSRGPTAWATKFKQAKRPFRAESAPGVRNEEPPLMEKVVEHGNWLATHLRRTRYVVDCPSVTADLTSIGRQVLKAAHREDLNIRIFVIASSDMNAFSIPNGDIYVCAGLLDMLDNTDEAAAVLAHEIDHLIQQDGARKICADYKTRVAIDAATFVLATAASAAASSAASGAAQGSPMWAQSAGDLGQSAGKLANAATESATMAIGSSVEDAFLMGYSQEAELRADSNAVRYTWTAGYDTEAFIHVFAKLEKAELTYKDQKQLACSNWINSKPGLPQREKDLKSTLNSLSGPTHTR